MSNYDAKTVLTKEVYEARVKARWEDTNYSDYHKDAYGFRPRTGEFNRVLLLTDEEFEQTLNDLGVTLEQNEVARKEAENHAVVRFEALVSQTVELGAKDRETAIQWLVDADETVNETGYFEYLQGLPYGYLKEVSLSFNFAW